MIYDDFLFRERIGLHRMKALCCSKRCHEYYLEIRL